MSVQKLVAEADKLFEKGKVPEGIAKLKAALTEEPLNQIVATKLAGIYVQNREPLEASKVYGGLAKRLSDAGKSSVAIAIYKQALELSPDDIALRFRYATECEAEGKLGDAFLQGQIVLNYYLRRKKYFDASNVLPLMARAQPKDDKIKAAWIDVMQLCQADQKLANLLVALCGPPGMVAADFPVGGDPVTLTPALYEGLKRLVPFFPRDGKIAYSLAWSAYRRGRKAEMYHFLHECLRREPDFCLAILLFARVLAEEKRLNEALFLYRYYKERMASDKNVDMLTLNRLLEAFLEKNGWIKFTEESGDLLDTAGFLKAMTGVEKSDPTPEDLEKEGEQEERVSNDSGDLGLPPAEIEIGGLSSSADPLEILNATGQSIEEASRQKRQTPASLSDPMRMQAELIKATVEAAVAGLGGGSSQQPIVQPVVLPVIQAAAIQGAVDSGAGSAIQQALTQNAIDQAAAKAPASPPPEPVKEAPSSDDATGVVEGFKGQSVEFTSLIEPAPASEAEKTVVVAAEENEADEEGEVPKEKKLFNPLDQAILPGKEQGPSLKLEERQESTLMFSPMDVLDAAKIMQNRDVGSVDTKRTVIEPPAPPKPPGGEESLPAEDAIREADKTKWCNLDVAGEKTEAFSPVDSVQATNDSRRPRESAIPLPAAKSPEEQTPPVEMVDDGGATAVAEIETVSLAAHTKTPVMAIDPNTPEAEDPGSEAGSEGPAFMPIPSADGANKPGASDDQIDLGDDLLEGPTRIFTPQSPGDKTEHLLKEIKQDLKHAVGDRLSVEVLMKKAERFAAKRNYYLARKALRHAQALGADDEMIKARLREIRKLELPEGLYNTMSSDQAAGKVDTAEVLERLELEFDLTEMAGDGAEMSAMVEKRIDAILSEHEPRTILDFGVGLHEMGLFRQAEALFIRMVEKHPDHAFDAYYLAAVSKLSRRDYAGAASILKRLSSDSGKTDLEKIQIYYALGETFEKMRQLDRSKQFFKKVAELDANYRNIRHKLGD